MLQYLKIKNLALLDEVTLELNSGFTAVTGETGAGKSVLLGALSLLSGGRSDKTMIRHGANLLEVEGAIYLSDSSVVDNVLEKSELPPCEEGVLLLKRRIHREKMQRIQINGSMATLAQLRLLGEVWIDFHGPGEPQKLFEEKYQLKILDLYAKNADYLASYKDRYNKWVEIRKEIWNLETSERLTEDTIDFLHEQVRQIERLQISETSIEALEKEYTRMASAQDFLSLAAQCSTDILCDQGIINRFNKTVNHYEALVKLDDDASSLLERARSALIELQDLGEETERLAGDFDFDAEEVEALTERMNLWQEMRRKYGGSTKAVIAQYKEMKQKLAAQGNVDELLQQKKVT